MHLASFPVVGRELLVSSRKPMTFWSRWVAVLAACLISSGFLLVNYLAHNLQVGRPLFSVLTGITFVGALLSGVFLTADCISEEKREGTLGFLFLTELKGLDVIAGKLMATSLRGVYALLAIMPIMAIPLTMGGTSGTQFSKTVLALLATLFLSLSAGLFISTVSRKSHKAMGGTFSFLALITGGSILVDTIWSGISGRPFSPYASLLSPGFLFSQAGAFGRSSFWPALIAVALCALALLGVAAVLVSRTWQERRSSRKAKTAVRNYSWRFGKPSSRKALRDKLLDANPVLWLVCRERWQAIGVWFLVFIVGATFVLLAIIRSDGSPVFFLWPAVGSLASLGLYVWGAVQASRFLVEARRNRAIELLLASPLEVAQIVNGQWSGFLRLYGLAVVLLLLFNLVGGMLFGAETRVQLAGAPGAAAAVPVYLLAIVTTLASVLATLGNILAITWFGIYMGLTSRTTNLAALKTILFVMVVPWFVLQFATGIGFALIMIPLAASTSGGGTGTPSSWFLVLMVAVPAFLAILKDIFFIVFSRRQLHSSFRERILREFIPTIVLPPRLPQAGNTHLAMSSR